MCRHKYAQCKIVGIFEQQIALRVNRSYVVYHNREQYGPEDSTLRYPSVTASKFGDKAVHDYSLFPVTKKADNPIDSIWINITSDISLLQTIACGTLTKALLKSKESSQLFTLQEGEIAPAQSRLLLKHMRRVQFTSIPLNGSFHISVSHGRHDFLAAKHWALEGSSVQQVSSFTPSFARVIEEKGVC